MKKYFRIAFFLLVCLSVTAALWVAKDYLFPFVTTKAFFFRICVELAFPLYLFLLLIEPGIRPSLKQPLNAVMLGFAVINFIAAIFGADMNRSLWGNFERMGGAYYIAHMVALYFYVVCLGQMGSWYLQVFLKFLLGVGIVVAGNGIFGWLHWPTLVVDPSLPGRVSSTLGNPIYLGSFLIIPIFLSLFFARQSEGLGKQIWYYFLAFLCTFGVFLSGTRGAVVGLLAAGFVSAVIFIILNKNSKIRRYGSIVVLGFVIIAGVLFNFSAKLPEGSILQRVFHLKDSNAESRLLQWGVALKGFKDRPFLGTGPENYYIVANKYYNPEIYNYDVSWFDKPHNYYLEILVTDGIAGFAAYMAILVFIVWAFWRGFKFELYGLAEFCFLLAAFLAYQIQNVFVFDTVPASLMFFSFAGFAGYVWFIAKPKVKTGTTTLQHGMNHQFAFAVLLVSFLMVAYGEYATNFVPLAIAKNVNYGYAYGGVDPVKAYNYFQAATSLPFNFDETETANKYSDFVVGFVRGATAENRAVAIKALDDSTNYLKLALATQPSNPVLWEHLSTAYLFKSVQVGNKILVDPEAEDAIQKAISLVPKRNEAYLSLAQIRSLQGNYGEAEKILLAAIQNLPKDKGAKLQLAALYRQQGLTDKAVQVINQQLAQGYSFPSYADMKWLIDYYTQKKQFDKALDLQLQAAKIEPDNLAVFIDLAHLYMQAGKTEQAKNLAQSILTFEVPQTAKTDMQALIDSINKTASSTPVKK